MTKPFLGLRTTVYYVPDINTGKEWYAKVLETEPYFDEPFYVGFNVGGYELGVHPIHDDSHKPSAAAQAFWGVEDVHASFNRLLAMGATALCAPNDVGDGIAIAEVTDPWGNAIGIIQNPHFKLPE
ncbi:MAG: VOC family protein [Chitinophagia bacterium]|nr:VOC family protein [Chitinophagia bacterium]